MDFLKLNIQNPEEIKGYFPQFLKEWRNFYPDQLKTHVDTIAYSKKISKLEAIKLLEEEVTEQFYNLVDIYQNFPNPFKIYTLWPVLDVNEFLKHIKGGIFAQHQQYYPEFWAWSKESTFPPEFWAWSKESTFPPENIDADETVFMTGLIFKKEVNWPLTLMKNCILVYGLDEKEIVLLERTAIDIVKIEGKIFLREFKR